MKKIYAVTYNTDANFSSAIFHNYITSLFPRYISDWWHYTSETYLVASDLNVNQLYNLVYPGVPGRNLLIIEVVPNSAQGWLPAEAWQWIKKYKS